MPDGLGEHPDHVVEVRGRAEPTVPPGGICCSRTCRHPRLVLTYEARVHVPAQLLEVGEQQGVDVVVRRVAEGRREHDRPQRAGLMVVVDDLREPLRVGDPVHVTGLREVPHEEVAIVVVAGVALIEHREPGRRARPRVRTAHVPRADQLHPVRVRVHGEDDHVVEEARGLRVGQAHQIVDELHELVGAEHLVGVQAAVDPDDRPALLGQPPGLLPPHPVGACQPVRDLPETGQIPVIRGGAEDGHELRTALLRESDGVEHHAVGLAREPRPVRAQLGVGRELVVRAQLEPEHRLGAGDAREPRLARRVAGRDGEEQQRAGGACEGSTEHAHVTPHPPQDPP